jgi:hypothetical protein
LLKDLVANLFYTLNTQDFLDTLTLTGNLFRRFARLPAELEEVDKAGESGEMGKMGDGQNL